MSSDSVTVKEVESLFGQIDRGDEITIPKGDVLEWMQSPDLEVQGAVFYLIVTETYSLFIRPSLSIIDCHRFVLDYLERCFRESPNGKWAHPRDAAGYAFVTWFQFLWYSDEVELDVMNELKEFLENLYVIGDEDLRECIAEVVLATLFEDEQIKDFFEDWLDDAALEMAYKRALELDYEFEDEEELH